MALSSVTMSPSTFVNVGQPFFFLFLLGGPGSSGHLSTLSSTRSLSASVSGQPSSSWMPSLSSGSSGHLSLSSTMPSLSRSLGAGQPSDGSGGSPSSFTVGHASMSSGYPSPSVSTSCRSARSRIKTFCGGAGGSLSLNKK